MGTWNVGLYDNDTAADLRDDFSVWARIPGSVDDLVRTMVEAHPGASDAADEDYTDIWLALADRLHVYGLEHRPTFERARDIVSSGLDIELKRSLGLEPKDARKRQAVLDQLVERWAKPHPKPKKRNVMKAPEPQAFEAGTIVAYPTCCGEARNYADTANRLGWYHDGWGSGVILATGHERLWFAWAAAGRLSVHGKKKPTLEQCLKASIETQPCFTRETGEGTIAIQVDALPPLHAKRMEFEVLGHVQLDQNKVAELHPDIRAAKRVPAPTMHHVWTWWSASVWPRLQMRDPSIGNPKPAIALGALIA